MAAAAIQTVPELSDKQKEVFARVMNAFVKNQTVSCVLIGNGKSYLSSAIQSYCAKHHPTVKVTIHEEGEMNLMPSGITIYHAGGGVPHRDDVEWFQKEGGLVQYIGDIEDEKKADKRAINLKWSKQRAHDVLARVDKPGVVASLLADFAKLGVYPKYHAAMIKLSLSYQSNAIDKNFIDGFQ